MKCTNTVGSSESSSSSRQATAEQQPPKTAYDSFRTDSGYNSCSCQSISSTSTSDSGLSLSAFSDACRPARTTHGLGGDSGLALDCVYEGATPRDLNDLNKLDNVPRGTTTTSGDSGLGLEFNERFTKLSVSEKQPHTFEDNLDLSTLADAPKINENYPLVHELTNLDPNTIVKLVQDAYLPDKDGDTHLHLAVVRGRLDIILALIYLAPHPAYLDLQNNLYQTALHLAVLTGQSKVVRRLVVAGASLDVRNRMGNTPLHLACGRGDLDCVRELTRPVSVAEVQVMKMSNPQYRQPHISIPQNLEIRNYEGQMCVHLAAIAQYKEILRHLKMYGANINGQEGKGGRTPLCIAIQAGNPSLVEFLIGECQADINAANYAGITPFQMAYGSDPHITQQLVSMGAYQEYPNLSDSDSDSDYSFDETMDTGKNSRIFSAFI